MAAKLKIRKGDRVVVLTGRDKGKAGQVLNVIRSENRAIVQGVNIGRRHQKQTASQDGGIVAKEMPIHISNLALADPKTGKPTRVGYKFLSDGKIINVAAEELARIAGQKPVITKSRKSIATFKIRENQAIGVKVTLRQARMYEFLDRLINIALPRVRDFRGVTDRSFDGKGNYAVGIKEHIIFPEIDYDKIDRVWGMDVVICTTARTDEEARALIAGFNFPFRKAHRGTKAAA